MGAPAIRLLVALLLFAAAGCQPPVPPPPRPHIFLVSADALRPDHLSVNGYPRPTSPHIDAFARRAWHFPDADALIPKTGPSFATILTGQPPARHGVTANRFALPDAIPLLAERLAAAGYQTGAFVGNPVLTSELGYARGFAHFEIADGTDGVTPVGEAFRVWIDEVDWSRPVFAWIHYLDPHGPYTPPERYASLFRDDALARADERRVPLDYHPMAGWPPSYVLGAVPRYQRQGRENRAAAYVAAYDAEIRYVDDAVGTLLEQLDAHGVLDESVVVLLSDHGESLGEHDYWFEHGWFAYGASLRIALFVKTPGQREGRVGEGQATVLDVAPTLLALAGLQADLPGRNLLTEPPPAEPAQIANASTYPERYQGLVSSDWKYLRRTRDAADPAIQAPVPAEQLYDLRADPNETHDLAAEQPERVAALRRRLSERLAAEGEPAPSRAPMLDAATRARLEALGYAGE
jgi:arylsulfatase A-like enzyme